MCGVTGIFDCQGGREIDRALLARMNDSQFHRGPDQGGLHTEPGVGLGHRRLSIIDLSGGAQPLFNEDHSVVVVYNGEIYNFQGLSDELKAAGHRLPHPLRHRGHRPCLGGMGRGLRLALSRHVRLRHLGPQPPDPLPRPRPPRHQAALLCLAPRWPADLRLGAEGAAICTPACVTRSSPGRWRSISPWAMCPSPAPSSRAPSSCRRDII